MNDNPFRILETVCASTPNRQHYIILHAQNSLTGEKVWAIGDDQVCAVTREDFIRNRNVQYNDVLGKYTRKRWKLASSYTRVSHKHPAKIYTARWFGSCIPAMASGGSGSLDGAGAF